MKILLWVFIILGITYEIISQPLNGNYTIGGNSPDFATLQLAADALNARGVSGPVFFNIRPGVYSKNGGNNSVLVLDSTVAGLSETNKITFQPDATSGGNVDNVILQLNITNTSAADMALVFVGLDYITFRNITFRESETSLYHFNVLVKYQSSSFNPVIESVLFENCRFEGTSTNITKIAIDLDINVKDITIRGNTFIRLAHGIINSYWTFASSGYFIIEDNKFLAGYYFASPAGTTIAVSGEYLYVRRNILDYNGSSTNGFNGILIGNVPQTKKVFVEQNLIKGPVSKAMYFSDHVDAQPDSFIIANNMINTNAFQAWPNEYAAGILVYAKKANVLFNTIRIVGGSFNALLVYGNNCRVFNNIIVAKPSYGFNSAYNQGNNAANLQSDFNSIYIEPSGWPNFLFVRDGVTYYSLLEYQNATGLDSNSTSKNIEFVALDDLHLTECQSQDPEIRGISFAGITNDFDGEIRDAISPLMGADETDSRSNDMFGDPFVYALPGTAFSIANGKFDNLLADGLAVPDYDNNRIRLFHYNGNRTFVHSGTLQTTFPNPTEVKFFDVNKDGYLDLISGFYNDWLEIWWGDGTGGFTGNSPQSLGGHVRSIEIGNDNINNEPRVFLTIDDGGFPADISWMAYIYYDQANDSVDIHYFKKPVSNEPDTIYAVMDDMAIANIDNDPNDEIVALTVGIFGEVFIFNDTTISGTHYPYGTHYRYVFGNTASYRSSSITIDDFDGDGDNDILTTGSSSNELVLIKNLGNYNFQDEEIIARQSMGFVVMDYENDGDKDIVTINDRLERNGISVYLNDGLGNFTVRENCYFPHADGFPWFITAADFDLDGRTDIALTSSSDSLYVLFNLGDGIVGVKNEEIKYTPNSFSLEQNFPNPFNPTTTIQYSLPQAENVSLKIYNLLGEEVKTLVNDFQQAGKHSVQFNANKLASGIYFYRLQAGNFIQIKKMILIR